MELEYWMNEHTVKKNTYQERIRTLLFLGYHSHMYKQTVPQAIKLKVKKIHNKMTVN